MISGRLLRKYLYDGMENHGSTTNTIAGCQEAIVNPLAVDD